MTIQRPTPPGIHRPVLGWREWLALPDLGVPAIKVKVDTGARTSSLHAFALETLVRDGRELVRFQIHPVQGADEPSITVEVPVLDRRRVRSSAGHEQERPVIVTAAVLAGRRWPIEITLADRDAMGFRMLLGRQALRRRFLVNPGRSFLAGRTPGAPPSGDAPGPSPEAPRS